MLSVKNLTSSYGQAPVIHEVSLDVSPGEVCVIMGPNGAGKSTLLRTIMGIVPRVLSGTVAGAGGRSLDGLATHAVASLGIAYVPEGRGILNSLTVLENLQLGAALLKMRYPQEDVAKGMEKVLESFPMLKGRTGEPAGLLSGGQQQMLAIARALIARPSVLLLDEPSLGLAPLVRLDVAKLLRQIADSEQVAVLLAEQDITLAQRCADRAFVLRRGRIVARMEASELHDHERLRELYLGAAEVPRIRRILLTGHNSMEFFIQLIVGGLSVGGTYALVALGFVLIFGVANVLNIAHAQSIMLAPFFIFILMDQAKLPALLAIPLALVLTVVIALVVYAAAIRPFLVAGRQSGYLAPFIGSFGASLFIENILAKMFGSSSHPFPIEIPREVWRVAGIVLVPMQVVSMACVVMAALVLAWVVRRSGTGRAMRAVAENAVVAESQGISARRTIVVTVTIATILGALSGILFAAGNNELSPFMGMEYGLKGLVVMIIGGVTSLPGAVVAGLLLGVAEALTVGYLSSSFSMVISFGLLLVILVARPTGLFASASREARP